MKKNFIWATYQLDQQIFSFGKKRKPIYRVQLADLCTTGLPSLNSDVDLKRPCQALLWFRHSRVLVTVCGGGGGGVLLKTPLSQIQQEWQQDRN